MIDVDYRDLVGIVLFNHSDTDFAVKPGDRIIEMIVQVIAAPEVAEVEDHDATVRSCRGGGPRRHCLEVAQVKDLDALVDTSREVVYLDWWWNAREGTYLSVMFVCV